MHVIYSPKGKAKEYCELACNIYLKCSHSCLYCYCPQALHVNKAGFFAMPQPRPKFLESLKRDALTLQQVGETGPVLLSFIGDCYQPIDDQFQLTRQAIEILHFYGQSVTILTKGGKRAERDFDLLGDGDEFAVTLTFLDEQESRHWEPYAAPPRERIESLRHAHEMGITTWASLEPVIEPEESLEIIRQTHTFIDLFKVGMLNHHELTKEIDWHRFANEAVQLLESLGKNFYIKKDLRRYL